MCYLFCCFGPNNELRVREVTHEEEEVYKS